MLLQGQYVPLSERLDYEEKVTVVDAFFGSKAHYVLSQYVKRVLEAYTAKGAAVSVEKQKGESVGGAWADLEEGVEMDKMWPCEVVEVEAESYPYPHELLGQDWEAKKGEEIG